MSNFWGSLQVLWEDYRGVDNIFDKTYREFISKGAADIAGYNPVLGQQLNEPGRQFWLRLEGTF